MIKIDQMVNKDHINEVTNIANGNIHPLKYYIMQVHELMKSNMEIIYTKDEVSKSSIKYMYQ